jgi:hypothetical protein
MPTAYSERAELRSNSDWLGRVVAAAKEQALAVMVEPTGPNNKARWAFAQQVLRDQIPPGQISDVIVADGVTTTGATDAALKQRCAQAIDILVGPLSYQPPA